MTPAVYLTREQVAAYMPTNEVSTTTVWNTFLDTVCQNVSRAFDTLTFRQPGDYAVEDDTTRYFDGVPVTATDYVLCLAIGELAALTSVSIAPNGGDTFTLVPADSYWLWPYNAAQDYKPYLRIDLTGSGSVAQWPTRPHSVQVIGKFGYSTEVPPDVYQALLLYAIRFLRKAQQNYLEVGTLLDTGQIMLGMKEDTDLVQLIQFYRKSRV